MATTKAIAYVRPNSILATLLGFRETGCYVIQSVPLPTRGYLTYLDRELVRRFKSVPGRICPFSQRNNPEYYYAI